MDKRNAGITLLILMVLIAATLYVSPYNRETLDKESGSSMINAWEYMSGNQKDAWTSIENMDPDMVVDADTFWIRGKLPETIPDYSPALFLEFDFPVEVSIDGEELYSYGSMEDRDRVLSFQHFIPIRDEYKGKMIYFRYSARKGMTARELKHLTAWDMVSENKETRLLVDREIVPVLLCTTGVFIGLCLMLMAIFQRGRQKDEAGLMAYAGGFVFFTSLNIMSCLYIVRAALDQPVLIFYMDYVSYYLVPYAAGSFLTILLKPAFKAHMQIINRIFPLYLASVLLLSLIPGFDISKSDYVFNTCFLSYAVFMMFLLLRELRNGSKDLRIIIVGLTFAGITGVFDIMSELKMNEYDGDISYIGIFVLSICMVCFLGLRYARLYDAVKAANMQLTKSKEYIEEINRDLDRKVIEKTSAIRSLFDNAEQGFLSFKRDMKVENEYSFKCCEIFGGDISGMSLPKLISNGNAEQEKFIHTLLERVFNLQDAARREVYFSLLPSELNINGKLINIAYKLIDENVEESGLVCMVILTDVTDKHLLEMKLEQERSILKMGVKVVANHNDFVDVVCDYKNFYGSRINEIINSDTDVENKYAELFRAVHTYKGNFAQFEMQHAAKKLHDFETTIDHFRRTGHGIEDLKGLLSANDLKKWLEEDFDILRTILGERYLKLDKLIVAEESKLKEIEGRILAAFPGSEGSDLARDLKKLRFRSIKDMLGHYPEYCMRISERLGKPVNDFTIQGADIAVDPDAYSGLIKVMVHVFRNMVDHGIETPEERIRNGKSELGNISCSIAADEEKIEIIACDDGSGIDFDTIRKIAAEKQFITSDQAAAATEAEVFRVIFSDGFTTADEITDLSGRGVGLPAVKAEVERMKGSIEVKTEKGKGTSFRITVPILS